MPTHKTPADTRTGDAPADEVLTGEAQLSDSTINVSPIAARLAAAVARADATPSADDPTRSARPPARIILFPTRAAAPPRAASAPRTGSRTVAVKPGTATSADHDRLTRALAALDAALVDQRSAMSSWRESLDHLRKATTGLGASMRRYHRTLGTIGSEVSDLHAQALRLERWADDTLAQPGMASAGPTDAQAPTRGAGRD